MSALFNHPARDAGLVTPGLYKHYKGRIYQVLFSVRHTETREPFVVYKAIHGRQTWARPCSMFLEYIESDGGRLPRFSRLSVEEAREKEKLPSQPDLFEYLSSSH
jgi:hypothetical protein